MNSTSPICPLVKLRTSFQGWFVFRKLLELLNLSEKIRREDQLMLIGPWEDKLGKVSLTATIHTIHSSWPQHYEREVWRNAIEDLVQPVLLLWGKNDPLNPGDVAVELLNKLPDATYFLHEECGHCPNLEQTDWVLGKMKEFIFRNRLRESA